MIIKTWAWASFFRSHIFYHMFIMVTKISLRDELPSWYLHTHVTKISHLTEPSISGLEFVGKWREKYHRQSHVDTRTNMHAGTLLIDEHIHTHTHTHTNVKECSKCISVHILFPECFTKIANYHSTFQYWIQRCLITIPASFLQEFIWKFLCKSLV
jgi:hypothetical protein